MTEWLFGLVLPAVAVFAAIRPTFRTDLNGSVLTAGLAAGLGLGLPGSLFVAWRFLTPATWLGSFPMVDALLWTSILAGAVLRRFVRGPILPPPGYRTWMAPSCCYS